MRMKSTYPATVYNVKIGTVDFGTVLQNSTSDYKQIEAGSHKITGNTSAGQQLTGTLSVSGKGTHKFTVNLSSAGELSVSED
ncbi:MAG: hypothetical protein J0L75_06970 [Spirochaetes bacterium]|nr:hypothetical protein [Spirochaetota bacterium]